MTSSCNFLAANCTLSNCLACKFPNYCTNCTTGYLPVEGVCKRKDMTNLLSPKKKYGHFMTTAFSKAFIQWNLIQSLKFLNIVIYDCSMKPCNCKKKDVPIRITTYIHSCLKITIINVCFFTAENCTDNSTMCGPGYDLLNGLCVGTVPGYQN